MHVDHIFKDCSPYLLYTMSFIIHSVQLPKLFYLIEKLCRTYTT